MPKKQACDCCECVGGAVYALGVLVAFPLIWHLMSACHSYNSCSGPAEYGITTLLTLAGALMWPVFLALAAFFWCVIYPVGMVVMWLVGG